MAELDGNQRYTIVGHHSLYNRMVLATAIVGTTARGRQLPRDVLSGVRRRVIKVSPFDALASRFDADRSFGMAGLVDEAREEEFWYIEVDNHERFSAFLGAYDLGK